MGTRTKSEAKDRNPYYFSKGSGTPAEIIISAPHSDFRQQKLEIIF